MIGNRLCTLKDDWKPNEPKPGKAVRRGCIDFMLQPITDAEMEKLLARPSFKLFDDGQPGQVYATPMYYDSKGNVWPLPTDDMVIVDA